MDQLKPLGSAMTKLGLALAIAAGIALRLAYPGDIEWKGDEVWTFVHAQSMVAGGPWPWSGMTTSLGPPNPGMSLWVFAGLFAIFGVETPPDLARAVQSLNIAPLAAFAAFAFAVVPKQRREQCLWAAALWAVNPLAVIFERKIWPPSVLPLAMIAFMAAWWFRRRVGAAFAWGLLRRCRGCSSCPATPEPQPRTGGARFRASGCALSLSRSGSASITRLVAHTCSITWRARYWRAGRPIS